MGWAYEPAYEEELDRLKNERPICGCTDDGKHVWIEFQSDNIKECHECGYQEDIVIPT